MRPIPPAGSPLERPLRVAGQPLGPPARLLGGRGSARKHTRQSLSGRSRQTGFAGRTNLESLLQWHSTPPAPVQLKCKVLPRQIQISVQTGPTSPASGALDWKGPQPPALGPPSVARRLIQFAAAAADSLSSPLARQSYVAAAAAAAAARWASCWWSRAPYD